MNVKKERQDYNKKKTKEAHNYFKNWFLIY